MAVHYSWKLKKYFFILHLFKKTMFRYFSSILFIQPMTLSTPSELSRLNSLKLSQALNSFKLSPMNSLKLSPMNSHLSVSLSSASTSLAYPLAHSVEVPTQPKPQAVDPRLWPTPTWLDLSSSDPSRPLCLSSLFSNPPNPNLACWPTLTQFAFSDALTHLDLYASLLFCLTHQS